MTALCCRVRVYSVLRVAGVLGLAVASLALSAPPALAGTTHQPTGATFGSFSAVEGVAVDQPSGDLYVIDQGAGQVLRFDAAGNPHSFSALGSNVLDGSSTRAGSFAFAGSGAGQVAVDRSGGASDGDVYVADTTSKESIFGE